MIKKKKEKRAENSKKGKEARNLEPRNTCPLRHIYADSIVFYTS